MSNLSVASAFIEKAWRLQWGNNRHFRPVAWNLRFRGLGSRVWSVGFTVPGGLGWVYLRQETPKKAKNDSCSVLAHLGFAAHSLRACLEDPTPKATRNPENLNPEPLTLHPKP